MSLQRIIWIASFPKSGNTWLRVFLANCLMAKREAPGINELRRFTTADVRQDFFDKAAGRPFRGADFDDWLMMRPKALRLIAASRPRTHFVKTHSRIERIGPYDLIPPDVTAAAVYLMRNPFDVAPSYARHLGMDVDAAIEMMLKPKAMNTSATNIFEVIGRWDAHIASWLGAPGLPRHVLRYEDMLADPERTFRILLNFLRAPVTDGRLRRAIRAASFDSLKKQEKARGFIERPEHMQSFFTTGKAGGWRDDLTPAQVARLREAFLPALEKHWPEMLDETAEFAGAA